MSLPLSLPLFFPLTLGILYLYGDIWPRKDRRGINGSKEKEKHKHQYHYWKDKL
jgi:hypothetical protein